MQTPMLNADLLAELIIGHAQRNEQHAIYALIRARDQIWADNANSAIAEAREKSVTHNGRE